jgi:hypothetical protein
MDPPDATEFGKRWPKGHNGIVNVGHSPNSFAGECSTLQTRSLLTAPCHQRRSEFRAPAALTYRHASIGRVPIGDFRHGDRPRALVTWEQNVQLQPALVREQAVWNLP